jgi:carbon storage regulator
MRVAHFNPRHENMLQGARSSVDPSPILTKKFKGWCFLFFSWRFNMLVLSRRNGEEIRVGDRVTILVVKIGRGKVRIGIEAPPEIAVHRAEFADRLLAEEIPIRSKEPIV